MKVEGTVLPKESSAWLRELSQGGLFRPEESKPQPQPFGAVVLGGLADALWVVRVTVPPERPAASDLFAGKAMILDPVWTVCGRSGGGQRMCASRFELRLNWGRFARVRWSIT